MKFFKHFVDGHSSAAMTALMNEWGVEGYGAYFILMEMCVAKIEKERDEMMTMDHCSFRFNERQVREKLRMRSTKVELFLNSCSTLKLLQFTRVEQEFNFHFPKILEFLDRDAKRPRHERALAAPRPRLDKDKDKDKDKEGGARPETKTPKPSAPAPSVQDVIGEYISQWQARYGSRPDLMPVDHKKLKELAMTHGREKSVSLITAYFKTPDPWFETKAHDVQTLMSNLGKIQAAASGKLAPQRSNYGKPEPRPVNYSPAEKVLAEMHDDGPRGAIDVKELVNQAFGYHPKKGSA